jgi:enamine deaminase RidA (YjgF/YER057c/UK114 family)
MRAAALLALFCLLGTLTAPAQRRKKKEEQTQVLQLPKDLPNAVVAETRRLAFYVTPLSAKGLLSQQVRDGLKALAHDTAGDQVVHIRAFVAGTGDLRRVRDLISEIDTDRHQPLPALSLVQAGGFGKEGAQVVLEAVAAERKDVNPHGLAFFSAPVAVSANPLDPAMPLAAKSLAGLRKAIEAADLTAPDVLRVTCFFSALDDLSAARRLVGPEYPRAALDFVQTQRVPTAAAAGCEAVARLRSNPGPGVRALDSAGLEHEPGLAAASLVGPGRLVLTGTQVSFGYQEQDGRLAFERLAKELAQNGSSPRDAVMAHFYPLSLGMAAQVRKLYAGFFQAGRPPAGSLLLFEGLPSMDAGFAVDMVAAKPDDSSAK